MGEIIIKVPEDVREVIDLGLSYKEVKENLEKLEKMKKLQLLKELTNKYGRKLDIPTVREEELYEWEKEFLYR